METGSRYSSQSQMGLCLHCVEPKSYFSFRFWIDLWTDGTLPPLLCRSQILLLFLILNRLMDWWDSASIVSIPKLTSLSDFESTYGQDLSSNLSWQLMGLQLFCVNTKSENISISNLVSWSLGRNLAGETSIVLSDTLKSDFEKIPLHLKSDIVSCYFWCLISTMEKNLW